MNLISDFFKKFNQLQNDSEEAKRKIILVIQEFSGIRLSKEGVELREGILYLKCSPLERTQIYLYKNKITERLASVGIRVSSLK